jgi:hypothetical protein
MLLLDTPLAEAPLVLPAALVAAIVTQRARRDDRGAPLPVVVLLEVEARGVD